VRAVRASAVRAAVAGARGGAAAVTHDDGFGWFVESEVARDLKFVCESVLDVSYEFTIRLVGNPYASCLIRRFPGHGLLAAHRNFSQLSTSFIASRCLGIHRAPFVA
jgi:hypothetical protein